MKKMKYLPVRGRHEDVAHIFDVFERHGKELYIVGGAVRDLLLGLDVHDIDFTTDALPLEIANWFEKTVTVGARYGTVAVILNGRSYEITTYRAEDSYSDGRHPDALAFGVSAEEDVRRRDFTMNALLMDKNGAVIDWCGGLGDIKNGIVRAIGNSDRRFEEDELRKWRCVRFAAEKGFEIDPATRRSIDYDPSTDNVSLERIREELSRILLSEKVNWGGYLLVRSGLYPSLLLRLLPDYLERIDDEQDLIAPFEQMYFMKNHLSARLAALTLMMEEDEARHFLTHLGYATKIVREVLAFKRAFGVTAEDGVIAYKKMAAEIGRDQLFDLCDLQSAAAFVDGDRQKLYELSKTLRLAQEIYYHPEPLTRRDLKINGSVLKLLGYQNTEIKDALAYLLLRVYEDPSLNTREKLKALLNVEEART